MKHLILIVISFFSCTAQSERDESQINDNQIKHIARSVHHRDSLELIEFYRENASVENRSKSIGTVSNGKLENGKIVPFYGSNYTYFDRDSYLASRAFTSDVVKSIVLDTYDKLNTEYPNRKFYLMELSNREGGEIYPHRTHQNGLSVDFMMPKIRNDKPDYSLDTLGKQHYTLQFNDRGEYLQDTSIKVDFDLIAKHILLLNKEAKKWGYAIEKVIIKIEYKNTLFKTPNGKILEKSGIYLVKNLSPLINTIHDDHFHIDFKKVDS